MSHYIGRFAPSPTGPLHFGTLIAAVASYLQARSNNGLWLLRIEDVDTLRNVENMDVSIINTLLHFGFEWDGEISYQTQRNKFYQGALDTLIEKNRVFYCTCSRKTLRETATKETIAGIYPGTCRERQASPDSEFAIRLRVTNKTISFHDAVMGLQQQQLENECGDFIIKRRDGLFAYQLACVVDDALQGITEVVRGADLLDSTPRQIYLQQQLEYHHPSYLHLPLVLNNSSQKLSKSTAAPRLDHISPANELVQALRHLGQQPPGDLAKEKPAIFWEWAIKHWQPDRIPRQNQYQQKAPT